MQATPSSNSLGVYHRYAIHGPAQDGEKNGSRYAVCYGRLAVAPAAQKVYSYSVFTLDPHCLAALAAQHQLAIRYVTTRYLEEISGVGHLNIVMPSSTGTSCLSVVPSNETGNAAYR